MKVCTDSCLFGAWVAATTLEQDQPIIRILDIGTGTGLLSLMLAQQLSAATDAIELDPAAAEQAAENFANSNWKDLLKVTAADISNVELNNVYDVVISNPPFFENSLRGNTALKNTAKHTGDLTFDLLVAKARAALSAVGTFYVLLPYQEYSNFQHVAIDAGLNPVRIVKVRQTPGHGFFRVMAGFRLRNNKLVEEDEIIIKNYDGSYSNEFTRLLKEYYLYL